ncbi:MAG: ribose 5-phosphate isomerase B [Bacteroidota bacterium]
MNKLRIAAGADHAGFRLKEKIREYLASKGYEIRDYGCYSEERADYPDFAHPVARAVENKEFDFGLLICGSGNGINMAANKHPGIRSAICWQEELAKLARQHNDANIIVLPARFISEEEAKRCVDAFFSEKFEGGRHSGRVEKISKC